MVRIKIVRTLSFAMAIVLTLSIGWIMLDAFIETAEARDIQGEINRLREERDGTRRRRQEIQARINTIEYERMTELARKSVLDDRITLTGLEIDNIIDVIEQYGYLIVEKEQEVIEAQTMEDEQLRRYRLRVRDMEENGVISYLEIIFDSTSFADLLARIDFVSDIMRADERAYQNLIAAREQTQAAEEALREALLELEQEQLYLEQKREELYEQLNEAESLIAQIQADLDTDRALYDEVLADEARITRAINAAVTEQARQEEARRLRDTQRVRGTGQLMWPVPSSTDVTSTYGMRFHPVHREMRSHSGIDIGARQGANVVAADTGTVVISDYNASYGHYIVINHGNVDGVTMTTLYAHLSSRRVSAGDEVSKGQVIGLIGSTGVSTGPHLHFEVRVNGSLVNPLSRL